MNAAGSCLHNSGNFKKQSCVSFVVSAFATAGAHSGRAGGGESSREWENKSRIMHLWWLDKLTPVNIVTTKCHWKRNSQKEKSRRGMNMLCGSFIGFAKLLI